MLDSLCDQGVFEHGQFDGALIFSSVFRASTWSSTFEILLSTFSKGRES